MGFRRYKAGTGNNNYQPSVWKVTPPNNHQNVRKNIGSKGPAPESFMGSIAASIEDTIITRQDFGKASKTAVHILVPDKASACCIASKPVRPSTWSDGMPSSFKQSYASCSRQAVGIQQCQLQFSRRRDTQLFSFQNQQNGQGAIFRSWKASYLQS